MNDFYFWLGEDGELESLTLEEFEQKIQEEREIAEKYRSVGLNPPR